MKKNIHSDFKDLDTLNNVSIDENTINANGKDAKIIFTEWWKVGRIVLNSMCTIFKNPMIKILCSSLIRIGDALYDKLTSPTS